VNEITKDDSISFYAIQSFHYSLFKKEEAENAATER